MGLEERQLIQLRQSVHQLKLRHNLYGDLHSAFARLKIVRVNRVKPLVVDENHTEDEETSDDHDDPRDEEDESADEEETLYVQESVQVLDSDEWEKYLNAIDPEQSILTLKDALELTVPLQLNCVQWLCDMKQCALFVEKVWKPMVESNQNYPLCQEDLLDFVRKCSDHWVRMARSVADGTANFQEMDEITRLEYNPDILAGTHLRSDHIIGVQRAYQNFKNLKELRHLIGPFVSALRFFSIRQRDAINKLHQAIESNLLQNWEEATLAQVTEKGILKMVNQELKFDPERPEARNAMQFVSSLATDGTHSPLIEWLREKTEKDMEAIGKILQGGLIEAYGNRIIIPSIAVYFIKFCN